MAETPNSINDEIWNHLLAKRRAAIEALEQGRGKPERHLEIIHVAEQALLGTKARGLLEVLYKLTFLWGGCRSSDDPVDKQKARILDDLAYLMGPIEVPAD